MILDDILQYIHQADDDEINQIIDALTARYKRVYPGWEVIFATLPLEDTQRRRTMLEMALKIYPGK